MNENGSGQYGYQQQQQQQQYTYGQYRQGQYGYQPQPGYNTEPAIPPEYKPLGAWAYFGWAILFYIPLIGLIIRIVFACGGTQNINLRNFARATFCALLVGVILAVIALIIIASLGFSLSELQYYF